MGSNIIIPVVVIAVIVPGVTLWAKHRFRDTAGADDEPPAAPSDRFTSNALRELESPPWYAVVSRTAVPLFPMMLGRSEEHVALLDQARLALALEVHVARHGGLPETLEDLDDDLIPSAPVDPFTGEPYVYERVGETGFALRSVGPDGEDDRGADDDVPWATAD